MSNFAALIDVLSIAGSRLSDGSPNASGFVWFFEPGGNTPANAYGDADAATVITQPITLTSGGTLNASDFPNGIYVTDPVRMLVQSVDGVTVVDTIYIPATAGDVGVNNAGFTDSDLDDVLTKAFTSFGGVDWKYQESGGATSRTIKSKFAEIWISVKDFGAVGDGVHVDTTQIQQAVNRVKALGGGVVYFPSGTYLIDQAITLSSANGVSLVGTGPDATFIKSSNASANCFTINSCNSFQVRGLTLSHATSSTGTAFALDTCNAPTFDHVIHAGNTNVGWRIVLSLAASPNCAVNICNFTGESSNAASRGITVATNSGNLIVFGGVLSASAGYGLEVGGNSGGFVVVAATVSAFRYAAAANGSPFTFVGCTVSTISVATATAPIIFLIASSPRESTGSAATGGNITPTLLGGHIVTLTASGGGAGTVTVNNPAILPVSTTGQFWDFALINTAGGAITWSFGAAYRLNGAVSNNSGQTTIIRFYCDGVTIREASFRSVTTT